MPDIESLVKETEALCRAVATRDLAGFPLYIVCQSALPPECGTGGHHYGYTTPSLDLYLADHIPDYRGRGPCFVIDDIALAEDYGDDWTDFVPTVALHELAHILDRPALFADRTGVDPGRILFEKLLTADISSRPPSADIPAIHGHGASFRRIVLHLYRRAERLGFEIYHGLLCAGSKYGLSHASLYLDALGDEPQRRVNDRFSDILASTPPSAFTKLWRSDLRRIEQRRRTV